MFWCRGVGVTTTESHFTQLNRVFNHHDFLYAGAPSHTAGAPQTALVHHCLKLPNAAVAPSVSLLY